MAVKDTMKFADIFTGKKVLITGDSGFKGSWLSIWLLSLGAEVYGYSLEPESLETNFVKTNLNKKICHKTADIRNKECLHKYIQEIQPEIVFHLAAQPIVLEAVSDPHYTYQTNLMGTVNICEAIKQVTSVKAAVIITSDKVYENKNQLWGYRENDTLGGKDPYSSSKACCELIVNSYRDLFVHNKTGCAIATARAGNVIGGGDWGKYRIIPDFFRSIKDNKPLIIRNPGFTRPWQYVLEPLSGYLLLAAKLYTEGTEYQGAWNFGPAETKHINVLELVKKIINISGKGSFEIAVQKNQTMESQLLKLDISKASEKLHWNPVLNINECIKFTAEGYMEEEYSYHLFEKRINQINDFTRLDKQKNIES